MTFPEPSQGRQVLVSSGSPFSSFLMTTLPEPSQERQVISFDSASMATSSMTLGSRWATAAIPSNRFMSR